MNPCANFKTSGCKNTSQRGSIICNECIESKKNSSKNKREHNLDELFEKTNLFSEKNKNLENKLNEALNIIENQNKKLKELEKNASKIDYNSHLEKENIRITKLFENSITEVEQLIKEKTDYKTNYEQLKLDLEKKNIENERLKKIITTLEEENQKIISENKNVLDVQDDLSKRVGEFKNKLETTVYELEEIKKKNPIKKGKN